MLLDFNEILAGLLTYRAVREYMCCFTLLSCDLLQQPKKVNTQGFKYKVLKIVLGIR